MFIYAARNTKNGKLYVGLTTLSVAGRWAAHLHRAAHGSGFALHAAIRKYGAKAFVVEEVASLLPGMPFEELCELERKIIAQEDCVAPKGYNLTLGGEGVLGRDVTAKERDRLRGHWTVEKREELAAIVSSAWVPERRAKHSERQKSKDLSFLRTPSVRAKVSAAMKGKPKSEAAKKNSRAGIMKMLADPDRRASRAEKLKASWTPERRAAAKNLRIDMNAARAAHKTAKTKESAAMKALLAVKRAEHEVTH